jgi:hypothetical protein
MFMICESDSIKGWGRGGPKGETVRGTDIPISTT